MGVMNVERSIYPVILQVRDGVSALSLEGFKAKLNGLTPRSTAESLYNAPEILEHLLHSMRFPAIFLAIVVY